MSGRWEGGAPSETARAHTRGEGHDKRAKSNFFSCTCTVFALFCDSFLGTVSSKI